MDRTTLWQLLHTEGLVASNVAPELEEGPHTPWYTRAMLGFAGWLAGMFLVAFVGGSFAALFRDGPALLVLGVAFCALAVVIDRRARHQDVISQMALAIAIAGESFFVFGMAQSMTGESWREVAAGLVVLCAVVFVLGATFIFRLVAATIALAAMLSAAHDTPMAPVAGAAIAVVFAWLWTETGRWRELAWALALVLAGWSFPAHFEALAKGPQWPYAAANGLGLAWIAWRLTERQPRARGLALAGAAALVAACHGVPGVIAGVLLLVAGFAAIQPGLMALGTVAVVGYLSAYYYQLHQTLLVKSMWLAIAAVALLAALAILKVVFGRKEAA
jgi:hypothetical protein